LLDFINQSPEHHILKAAVAHLWMVTIHPFDDGNGRLARAISELLLARVDASLKRFYSMSEAILRQRKAYYSSLENAQSGTMDISAWMRWFLLCLQDALNRAAETMQTVIRKYQLLHQFSGQLNERQKKMIDRLMTGFKGNLTSAKWAKINKVSQMTANRDIAELITLKILVSVDRGPHTHYVLTPTFASDAFSQN
jgi:Fic family protein